MDDSVIWIVSERNFRFYSMSRTSERSAQNLSLQHKVIYDDLEVTVIAILFKYRFTEYLLLFSIKFTSRREGNRTPKTVFGYRMLFLFCFISMLLNILDHATARSIYSLYKYNN